MYPILFEIYNFKIGSYGIFLALAIYIGLIISIKRGKQHNFTQEFMLNLSICIILSGIIGARGLYILYYPSIFIEAPLGIFARYGFAFHGGLLLSLVCSIIYLRIKKMKFFIVADTIAPGIALGEAIARIGCFLNGCCFGKPTDLPWQVRFPDHSSCELPNISIHPTQLYLSIGNLIIFFILLRVKKNTFLFYLILNSLLRFFIEFVRADVIMLFNLVSFPQMFCCVIILLSLIILIKEKAFLFR